MKIRKTLKQLTLRRIFEGIFYYVEEFHPSIADFLRFYSLKDDFDCLNQRQSETININWFSEKYLDQFKQLASASELQSLDFSQNEIVPLITHIIKDFYIDGHIKAPIRRSTRKILSMTHPDRLRWGDVFPFPISMPIHLEGILIFIPNIENYYHIVVDHILPSLHRLLSESSFKGRNVYFILQRELPIIDLFVEFLNEFGFLASKFRLRAYHRVSGSELIVGRASPRDHGCYFVFSDLMKNFDQFIERKVEPIQVPKFVYVERSNTPRRKILNQSEISQVLKNSDFSPVSFSYHNYLYQIAIFRKSEIIISVHGASLTNLVWSRSIKVVEIFPENLRPKHYLNISAQLDLTYYSILGGKTEEKENFYLDPQKLAYLVDNLVPAHKI